MDTQRLRELADRCDDRATRIHVDYQVAVENAEMAKAAGLLNDYFYWAGHSVAYKGVIAMIELATIVEDEMDSEPTCP